MKKTSFYTLPTVMKVSMVCEAATPELGGVPFYKERGGTPFLISTSFRLKHNLPSSGPALLKD